MIKVFGYKDTKKNREGVCSLEKSGNKKSSDTNIASLKVVVVETEIWIISLPHYSYNSPMNKM